MNYFLRYSLCQIQGIRRNGGVCGCVPESLFDLVKRIIQVGIVYSYHIFVFYLLQMEFNGPRSLLGYRSMQYRLKYNILLQDIRDTVMMFLALLLPKQRSSKKLKRRIYRSKVS